MRFAASTITIAFVAAFVSPLARAQQATPRAGTPAAIVSEPGTGSFSARVGISPAKTLLESLH
jgi:hypothetical protein